MDQLIIGMTLTLSPPDDFMTLFIVIIFHRESLSTSTLGSVRKYQKLMRFIEMFEGLGLGTRLAFLQLPPSWKWVPLFGAIAYSVITPLGMVIGLGARQNLVSMGLARDQYRC